MIVNRNENLCPCCGEVLPKGIETFTEVDETGLIRGVVCECEHCGTTVFCRENYALCDIEQTFLYTKQTL